MALSIVLDLQRNMKLERMGVCESVRECVRDWLAVA